MSNKIEVLILIRECVKTKRTNKRQVSVQKLSSLLGYGILLIFIATQLSRGPIQVDQNVVDLHDESIYDLTE